MTKKILLLQILQGQHALLSHVVQLGIDINNLKKQNSQIMTKQEQLQASLDELAQATTAIGTRIQAFIDAQTDNVDQASLDTLQADADALKALGTPADTTPSTGA